MKYVGGAGSTALQTNGQDAIKASLEAKNCYKVLCNKIEHINKQKQEINRYKFE